MPELNINYCSEQMKLFLRDFLEDIRQMIYQIKISVYKITDLSLYDQYQQHIKINPNLTSILKNCNQTSDDLKRINLILKGYVINKEKIIQNSHQPSQFLKNAKNNNQSYYNNITFQNCLVNSIVSSSKTDDLIYDALTLNSQNGLNKLKKSNSNLKIHWRNKTQTQVQKINSDKELTDVQSFGDCITKRTNFSSVVKKSPNFNCLKEKTNPNIQISHFSIKKQPGSQSQTQIKSQKQNKRDSNVFFTFNKIQHMQDSISKSIRVPKISEDISKRNSQCLNLIRSIRKQLSK